MNHTETSTENPNQPARIFVPVWRCLIAVAVVAVGLALCLVLTTPLPQPEPGVSMELPDTLLGLPGRDQPVSEAELVKLPSDTTFAKRVYGEDPDGIGCQIVLAGADRRSIHRPEVCLPGQGWTIAGTETIPVPLRDGRNLSVTKLTLKRTLGSGENARTIKLLFLYWFVSREFTTPSHMQRILSDAWDMLVGNKLHRWAYVIVSEPVLKSIDPNARDEDDVLDRLKAAVAELAPQIMLSERDGSSP